MEEIEVPLLENEEIARILYLQLSEELLKEDDEKTLNQWVDKSPGRILMIAKLTNEDVLDQEIKYLLQIDEDVLFKKLLIRMNNKGNRNQKLFLFSIGLLLLVCLIVLIYVIFYYK